MAVLLHGKLIEVTEGYVVYEFGDSGSTVKIPVDDPNGYTVNTPDDEFDGQRVAAFVWYRRMKSGGTWPETFMHAS